MRSLTEIAASQTVNDPEFDIENIKESVLVLSEMESDDDPDETERAKVNLERVSSRLDRESPLKMLIDSFKLKYNISVQPTDVAIFV